MKISQCFAWGVTLLGLSLYPFSGGFVWADDVYTFVVKKEEEKRKVRWTLSDWLETRDRMRMQDLWLAIHSPSPFEYFVGANYQMNSSSLNSSFSGWEVFGAAFVTIFGLEARYESGLDRRWHGIFNLRVFGYHDQGSNITLQLGLRGRENENYSIRQALAGVSATMYLARPFGIEFLYRRYLMATVASSFGDFSGNRFQGGAFLDFHFIRIYGDYFSESDSFSSTSGVLIGTKLYF